MTTAAQRDLLLPRPPRGMGAGAMLALLVHALLFVALAFSVNWRRSDPAGVEAELWAAVPQVAAPEPTRAPPPPAPVPRAEPPKPEPRVEPKPPLPDPQIAIEREKREQAAKAAKLEAAEKAEKAERAEKAAREKAERDKAERERREEQRLAALREENLQRMQAQAGGAAPSTGNAAQTAGPSAGYAGRIKARIKPNVVFNENPDGNPLASVEVRAAADGTIIARRLLESSGVPAWDEAVLRAIDKTEVLPRDTDGRVPATIVIDFRRSSARHHRHRLPPARVAAAEKRATHARSMRFFQRRAHAPSAANEPHETMARRPPQEIRFNQRSGGRCGSSTPPASARRRFNAHGPRSKGKNAATSAASAASAAINSSLRLPGIVMRLARGR